MELFANIVNDLLSQRTPSSIIVGVQLAGMEEGGFFLPFFENWKKCPDVGVKKSWLCLSTVQFFIWKAVLRGSSKKTSEIISCLAFLSFVVDKMFIEVPLFQENFWLLSCIDVWQCTESQVHFSCLNLTYGVFRNYQGGWREQNWLHCLFLAYVCFIGQNYLSSSVLISCYQIQNNEIKSSAQTSEFFK